MVKDNRVYTLKHDVNTLQQTYDNDDLNVVKASPNYHMNENKKVHEYKMIEPLHDLLGFFQTIVDEKQIIH